MSVRSTLPPSVIAAALLLGAAPVHAQGLWGRMKARAKAEVQQKENDAADSAVDKSIDKATHAVKCVITNRKCIADAESRGQPVLVTDASGAKVSSADSAQAVAAATGSSAAATQAGAAGPAAAFVNYDFVPGDRVLFADDFSTDQVGDIPSRLVVKSGNWEVAEFQGQRFLRTTTFGWVGIKLPEVLPQKFTFEADIISTSSRYTDLYFVPDAQQDAHQYVFSGNQGGIGDFKSDALGDLSDQLYHVRVMADGPHVKVYEDGKRVANVPQANLGRSKEIWIYAPGSDNEPYYITNIRIAESQRKLFDVLNANGRVATHGILFDINSAHIRPESAPTLKEIGDMLENHPELKLTIEGHTDNTGDASANQSLSEQRALAVKGYLVTSLGVAATRLQAKGYGDTKPVASNDTPEGRQQNRRVELVKN